VVATTQVVTIEVDGVVRLPLALLERVGIKPGEELEVQPGNGWLALKKKTSIAKKLRGRLRLEQDIAEEIMFALVPTATRVLGLDQ
jgi:antitoxin component of MazEF toxin-antitoxin module